jgi:hypothetical protein
MLKHRCAALLIFHDAETPMRNTGDFLPDVETPLFSTFHFFPFPKTFQSAIPHHSHSQNNSVQHLFRFSPSIAETPLATTFPVAETLIVSNPSSVFPMLKHHCSTFFISFSATFCY